MKIYPAVDVYDGKCVGLKKGDKGKKEIFYKNPADAARMWEQKGAEALHIIDLNGAFEGRMGNKSEIERIINAVKIPVQVGGGLRNINDINDVLSIGAARVIIGTGAVTDEELLEISLRRYRDRVTISIDAVDGYVAKKGWVNVSEFSAYNFAGKIVGKGFRNIIYTDVPRNGTMSGPNLDGIEKICNVEGARITASGGVRSMEDLMAVRSTGAEGVIIGKALYIGAIRLEDALEALSD